MSNGKNNGVINTNKNKKTRKARAVTALFLRKKAWRNNLDGLSIFSVPPLKSYLFYPKKQVAQLFSIGVAMVVSGGIGNMIDRVVLGYVVDFLNFELINFAIFNVADSFVCVGAGLMVLSLLIDIIKEAKEKKK